MGTSSLWVQKERWSPRFPASRSLLILSLDLASLAFLPASTTASIFFLFFFLQTSKNKNISFICFPSRNSFYKHQFVRSNFQDEVHIHCRPWRVRRWCCRTGNVPCWLPFLWCKLTRAFALHVPGSRGEFLDMMARRFEVQWLCSRDGYLLAQEDTLDVLFLFAARRTVFQLLCHTLQHVLISREALFLVPTRSMAAFYRETSSACPNTSVKHLLIPLPPANMRQQHARPCSIPWLRTSYS
jgi:hypothetical protein